MATGPLVPMPLAGQPVDPGRGPVTLLDGASFCRSRAGGDLLPGRADGYYVRDLRMVSQLEVRVDGVPIEPLVRTLEPPSAATFVARAGSAAAGPAGDGRLEAGRRLLLVRRRWLGHGLRDDLVLRNLGPEATFVEVTVLVDGDLAPADSVRAGHPAGPPDVDVAVDGESLLIAHGRGGARTGCRVTAAGPCRIEPGVLRFEVIVPARGEWTASVLAAPVLDGEELEARWRPGEAVTAHEPSARLDRWRRSVPQVATDHPGLAGALAAGAEQLGTLRVMDPEHPERAVVAAGAPWHLALHGRDALLTSWMALLVDPELALGVVETLARFQGTEVDPRTEEEPGRILGRLRFGAGAFASRSLSYASIDATPLFVMLLGELRRWGLAPEVVDRLLPHADRALAWMDDHGDRDGDGYLEEARATDRGPRHQGWRTSPGALVDAQGRVPVGPLAPAEAQAYAYAALRARVHFAEEAGDGALADRLARRAAELRARFNRDFWLDDRGLVAVALDGDKAPVDVASSAVGPCLWAGILDEDKAPAAAKALLSPDLCSGWGLRTLGTSSRTFDPLGPHTGAVWPHDTALAVAGLVRYGLVDDAHRLVQGLLDVATALGGALPPVLCGFDRDDLAVPVAYPDGSTARAWTAASPFLVLRALLRFDPWVPAGRLSLAPALPPGIGRLRVERIPLLGGTVTIEVHGDEVTVDDLPPSVQIDPRPRRPTALPPTEVPPTEVPPTEVPPGESPHGGAGRLDP